MARTTDLDHLGGALRRLREHRELTQEDAAARIRERTGVRITSSKLSQYENGSMPSLRNLVALLNGWGADLHDLADALAAEADPGVRIGPPVDVRRLMGLVGEVAEVKARLDRLETPPGAAAAGTAPPGESDTDKAHRLLDEIRQGMAPDPEADR